MKGQEIRAKGTLMLTLIYMGAFVVAWLTIYALFLARGAIH